MEINLYNHKDYKSYIEASLKLRGHGAKKKLATFADIQESFLSQVLRADAELSLEQGDKVNQFFEHTSEEAHYFLLLIQKRRAGTASLKSYFQHMIDDILIKQKNLKEQIKAKSEVSNQDREKFYSSWQFAAVQVATSIKEFQTVRALSQKLNIPEKRLNEILEFLLSTGLVVRNGNALDMGTQSTHIGKDSTLVYKHHANWRLRTLQELEKQNVEQLHYSTVMSLSHEASEQIKNDLTKAIKQSNQTMESSKEEALYSLCVDFYEL